MARIKATLEFWVEYNEADFVGYEEEDAKDLLLDVLADQSGGGDLHPFITVERIDTDG